ncbi:MAG: Sec-independent protein translocase protein TatB [Actinomycetota bacterium]
MPSIGFGELVVILLFALIIFGPKRLPQMGRSMGNALREFRRSAAELRAELEDDVDIEERPTARTPSTKGTETREKPPEPGSADGAAS